ncbi:MAG TPA: hypothetical protein VFV50_11615 [Bdellovibrionales bacterium]|nr:hypothetical protein [Bdellovibrionales bacterium]
MILTSGSKVLVAHRRLFDGDTARYFVGLVDAYENGIAKVTGHTWLLNTVEGRFERKADQRTKIFSIISSGIFFYELPTAIQLDRLKLTNEGHAAFFLTDGAGFKMDLSENFKSHR